MRGVAGLLAPRLFLEKEETMRTVILLGFILLSVVVVDASDNTVYVPDSLINVMSIALIISIFMDVFEFIKNMRRK